MRSGDRGAEGVARLGRAADAAVALVQQALDLKKEDAVDDGDRPRPASAAHGLPGRADAHVLQAVAVVVVAPGSLVAATGHGGPEAVAGLGAGALVLEAVLVAEHAPTRGAVAGGNRPRVGAEAG